jgi:hypothetical protein
MRFAFAAVAALLVALCAQAIPQTVLKRRIPCKTLKNAASCYWTHGRLQEYEGTPAYRLWKIGTKRILGIYSGPSVYHGRPSTDNEDPEFPPSLRPLIHSGLVQVFGNFEVCPLEPERPGSMQAACIESGKNLFVQK